jgi:tetratricopeptide (TPR) repeat protein
MNSEQNPAVVSPSSSASWRIESWAVGIMIALVFLLPIIFIPIPYLQQNAIKGYLVIFGVLAAGILYSISRIKEKSFEWISHPLPYIGIILAVILIISSIWSGNFMKSFFGQGFEYGTAAFLIILGISARLSAIFSSRSSSRALFIYAAIFGSFILLAIFQIVKFIDPSALSFGIFTGSVGTPIGSWYDLGIFSGVVFILSGLAFLYFPMSRAIKYTVGVLFAVSFFFLVLVGLSSIWFGIALVFLALIFQRYFNEKKGNSFRKRPRTSPAAIVLNRPGMILLNHLLNRLPVFALIVFIVAVFFSWNGNIVTTPLINALSAGHSEIHLPWQMTLDVGTGIIKSSPIFGSGPNTFAKEYLLYKPVGINLTQFWSTEFGSGSGLIPTIALSLGLSGIILFCLFYIYFIRDGVRTLRKANKNPLLPYISYSSFFAGAFLLFMDLAYVPSYANFFLTFVFIGVFVGSRMRSGDVQLINITFNWKGKPAIYAHSFSILILLVLLVGFVWYGMKATALGYFTAGAGHLSSSSLSSADLTKAENDFHRALALDHLDIYDQAIVETDLTAANSLVIQISAAGSNAKPTQAQVQQIGALVNDAASAAADAVKRDSSNYYNYISSAQVFNAAATLQMQGAYAAAITAYMNAAKDNPYNPSIYLALARLAASQSKYDDATSYIGSALQLKNNYTDAVYLLSQIQVAQGKTADAITSVKFATQLTPNDQTAFFELGLLQYNAGEYSDAVTSLAKAVSLSPSYANAQYFLGLSYSKVGNNTDAIAQFQELAKTNPDNSDVASILANLKAGKPPFVNQTPPVLTPEKRSSLPIGNQPSKTSNNVSATSSVPK